MRPLNSFKYLLFVYGLLRKGVQNDMSVYLEKNAHFIGVGYTPGKLFLVEDYPGLVVGSSFSTNVIGDIYGFNEPALWNELDRFEDIGRSDEYERQEIEAEVSYQKMSCWAYIYQRDIDGLELIPSGDFLKYLKER